MPIYVPGTTIDDSNYTCLLDGDRAQDEKLEDGTTVKVIEVNGHKRYLSRCPKPQGHDTRLYSVAYKDSGLPLIPESEWDARIDDLNDPKVRRSVEDYDKYAPHDQNGFPSCWRGGTATAAEAQRVMQGNPFVRLSILSLCPNISPRVGGYEGNSIRSLIDDGAAADSVWDSNDPNMSLTRTPAVIESRLHHKGLKAIEWTSRQEFISGLLLRLVGPIAFDWWSHVVRSGMIGKDSDGLFHRPRNQWGPWGEKNIYGFDGYVKMRLTGRGMPDSGFFLVQMNQSIQ